MFCSRGRLRGTIDTSESRLRDEIFLGTFAKVNLAPSGTACYIAATKGQQVRKRDDRCYGTGSGPGSPSGQPAWGGGSDRVGAETVSLKGDPDLMASGTRSEESPGG